MLDEETPIMNLRNPFHSWSWDAKGTGDPQYGHQWGPSRRGLGFSGLTLSPHFGKPSETTTSPQFPLNCPLSFPCHSYLEIISLHILMMSPIRFLHPERLTLNPEP